jgi:hypothetical protein
MHFSFAFFANVKDTGLIEYRRGSVALHACSSDRAPESPTILSDILITRPSFRDRVNIRT